MKKKILALLLIAVLTIGGLTGCTDGVAQSTAAEKKYTEDQINQAIGSVGLPNTPNYFERAQLKTIYELRDDPNLICYWYTTNAMTGKLVYRGKCVGYGIPYSTQMTNPNVIQTGGSSNSGHWGTAIDQAEPNGLYSTGSTSATWILQTDSTGKITPAYVEDQVTVVQVKIAANLCEAYSLPSDY